MDPSEEIVSAFRAKAEDLRLLAESSDSDPWRRSVVLQFARECEILADEYEHRLRRRRHREH